MKDIILPGQGSMPQPQMAMVTAQLGMSPAMIGCSSFCVNCFPKPAPAFFMWGGDSLCHVCFIAQRKKVDSGEVVPPSHIAKRDYKETWGEEPVK